MESLEAVRRILRYRKRADLADLLERAEVEFDVSDTYGTYLFSLLTAAEIYAPIQDYERLKALGDDDNGQMLEALLEIWPPKAHEMEISSIVYRVNPSFLTNDKNQHSDLLEKISQLRNLMIAVSTGGPRVEAVRAKYRELFDQVDHALRDLKIKHPNPYQELWDWYGKWSSGDLPTYQSRRNYIRDLFEPLERLLREGTTRGAEIFEEPTGWARVDRGLGEAWQRLEQASTEEQFQTVGLVCREVLISLAQTVYDPERHPTSGGVSPSKTDAKRMLDAYLAVELGSAVNEIARKHAKAALDLANELQHRRTASFREAALCAEATASVVNIIAIVSGQRDPR